MTTQKTKAFLSTAAVTSLILLTALMTAPAKAQDVPATGAIGVTMLAAKDTFNVKFEPGVTVRYNQFNAGLQHVRSDDNGKFNLFTVAYLLETAPFESDPGVKVGLNLGVAAQAKTDRFERFSPLIAPTVSVAMSDGWAARLTYTPAVRANFKEQALAFSIERQF